MDGMGWLHIEFMMSFSTVVIIPVQHPEETNLTAISTIQSSLHSLLLSPSK